MRLERPPIGQGIFGGSASLQKGSSFRASLSALSIDANPGLKRLDSNAAGAMRPGTADSASKLGGGEYTMAAARKQLQVTTRSLNTGLLPTESLLSQQVMPAMRPSSASSTNMAAWKAYGSPGVRGIPRPSPPPSPSHANTNPHLFAGVASKSPRAQSLGGGFKIALRPSSAPLARPVGPDYSPYDQQASSPKPPGSPLGKSPKAAAPVLSRAGRAGAGGGRPASAQRPQEAAPIAVATADGDLRFSQTLPTDPYGKYIWEAQSRVARAGAAAAPKPSSGTGRRQGSGRAPFANTAAASAAGPGGGQRFQTARLSTLHQLGPAFRPPTVTGFATPDPSLDSTLPGPGDPRWGYMRLGRTQITKLQAALKMPTPQRERPTTAPAISLGRSARRDDGKDQGGDDDDGAKKAKKPMKEKESAGMALRRGGARFGGDNDEDDGDGGDVGGKAKAAGFSLQADNDGSNDEAPVFRLGAGRRKKAGFGGGDDDEGGPAAPPAAPAAPMAQDDEGEQPAVLSLGGGRKKPKKKAAGFAGFADDEPEPQPQPPPPAQPANDPEGPSHDCAPEASAAPCSSPRPASSRPHSSQPSSARGMSAKPERCAPARRADPREYLDEGDDGEEVEVVPVDDEPLAGVDEAEGEAGKESPAADEAGPEAGLGVVDGGASDPLPPRAIVAAAAREEEPEEAPVAAEVMPGSAAAAPAAVCDEDDCAGTTEQAAERVASSATDAGSQSGQPCGDDAVAAACREDACDGDALASLHGATAAAAAQRRPHGHGAYGQDVCGSEASNGECIADDDGDEDEVGEGPGTGARQGGEVAGGSDGAFAHVPYEPGRAGSLSRPSSVHRPASARPTSGRPTSARPTSAQPAPGMRSAGSGRLEYGGSFSAAHGGAAEANVGALYNIHEHGEVVEEGEDDAEAGAEDGEWEEA